LRAAILIFGAAVRPDGQPSRTLRDRTEAAARFGATLPAPLYMPTGAIGRHGPSEASVMRRLLVELGVPPEDIVLEETGTDTLSSVVALRRLLCLRPDIGRVYAATSGYHLPRCVLLLWLIGVRASPCPPPQVPEAMTLASRWYWWLRELAATPYDAILIVFARLTGRLTVR
jgi:uncharacterized SAM-binding protein YcdF (DUF218 family)